MNVNPALTRRGRRCVCTMGGLTLALMLLARGASAQTQPVEPTAATPEHVEAAGSHAAVGPARVEMYETLMLTNMTQQRAINDVMTDLRNMLPRARIYGVQSRAAISLWGTQEEIDLARKIVAQMDQPEKEYKLTFTITDAEGGKQAGAQHFSMIVVPGAKATMKQGRRVPIITGSYKEGSSGENTEVQYLDVGLSIEATLDGASLQTKVEQSTLPEEGHALGMQDPVIRQSVLEGSSMLNPGKTIVLGSLDIPGSTHHEEIELASELVR